MFNANDNSTLWFLILLLLATNNPSPILEPENDSVEGACEAFQKVIDDYLKDHKKLLDEARVGSPMWQLKELSEAAESIEDPQTRVKVLQVATSIVKSMEMSNRFCSFA
jgi:hypothetical protein